MINNGNDSDTTETDHTPIVSHPLGPWLIATETPLFENLPVQNQQNVDFQGRGFRAESFRANGSSRTPTTITSTFLQQPPSSTAAIPSVPVSNNIQYVFAAIAIIVAIFTAGNEDGVSPPTIPPAAGAASGGNHAFLAYVLSSFF